MTKLSIVGLNKIWKNANNKLCWVDNVGKKTTKSAMMMTTTTDRIKDRMTTASCWDRQGLCLRERERETQFAAWSYNTIAWLAGWPMILGEWGHALPWSAQVHRRAIDGLSVSVSLFWSLPIVRPSVATTCPNIGSMATADAAWRHKWPYNDIIHRRHTSSFPPRTRDTMCFDCTFVVESHVRFAVLHTLIHTVS